MSEEKEPAAPKRRFIAYVPLALFAALAAVFLVTLLSGRDASTIPSALVGRQAPATVLAPLEAGEREFDPSDLVGSVTLVNIWASWCAPCRQEHPVLMQLAQDSRLRIAGLNYKDKPENARSFLQELGDPYHVIGVDRDGRAAIEWGVYGVPETFLVGRDGTILHKHVGPLTPALIQRTLLPEIEKALSQEAPAS